MSDVERRTLVHELEVDQLEQFDRAGEAFHRVRKAFAAMAQRSGAAENPEYKKAVPTMMWGFQINFAQRILLGMQMPSVIKDMQEKLDAGETAVLQLVNTNEAAQDDALSKLDDPDDIETLNVSALESMVNMIMNYYPVHLYKSAIHPKTGKRYMKLVLDAVGKTIEVDEYVKDRNRLVEGLRGTMQLPDGPLEQVLNHTFMLDGKAVLGSKISSEVTGRKQRVIINENGEKILEDKPDNKAETRAFMDDKRRILMFSGAGATGFSYHADLDEKNQRMRNHYVLQAGWRADAALQGFGRAHRSNQKQAPLLIQVTTNVKSQRRFTSAVARRLDQMGALTGGNRQTGGKGVIPAEENLENSYANDAVRGLFRDILGGRLRGDTAEVRRTMDLQDNLRAANTKLDNAKTPEEAASLKKVRDAAARELLVFNRNRQGIQPADLAEELGFAALTNEDGAVNDQKLPPVSKFLNRLMSASVARNDRYYELFEERLKANIEVAVAEGTYDTGVEAIRGQSVEAIHSEVVYTDPVGGSDASYVQLEVTDPVDFNSHRDLINAEIGGKYKFLHFVLQKRSKRVYAIFEAPNGVRDGNSVPMLRRVPIRKGKDLIATKDSLSTQGFRAAYEQLDKAQAEKLWDAEIERHPKEETRKYNLISGDVLAVWKKIIGDPRVRRTVTDTGQRLIGRIIAQQHLSETLRNLGAGGAKISKDPRKVLSKLRKGWGFRLSNRWLIKTVYVDEKARIEIKGPDFYADKKEIGSWMNEGLVTETHEAKVRLFLSDNDNDALAILNTLLEHRDIVEETDPNPDGGGVGANEKAGNYQPGRDNATSEQRQMGQELIDEARGRVPLGNVAGVKTVASAIAAEMVDYETVTLVGQAVHTPEDIATLSQVYRDPRFETFRYFFADATGRIVGQVGISQRLTGSVAAFPKGNDEKWLSDTAARFGAAKIGAVHNHPSGSSSPSASDIDMAQKTHAALNGAVELQQVVINSNEYSTVAS
ncbi:hypothetical protein E4G67_02355, partial [Candidatus Bathyarchaeota archaeon]